MVTEPAHVIAVELDAVVAELQAALHELPALQALANATLTTLFINPETYRSSDPTRPAITVEYPTWLYLAHADPLPPAQRFDSKRFQACLDLIDRAISLTLAYYLASSKGDGPAEELRYRARYWQLMVRAPAYFEQAERLLTELFSPFDRDLRRSLGFCVSDAIEKSLDRSAK
jgi:hypothetical protein